MEKNFVVWEVMCMYFKNSVGEISTIKGNSQRACNNIENAISSLEQLDFPRDFSSFGAVGDVVLSLTDAKSNITNVTKCIEKLFDDLIDAERKVMNIVGGSRLQIQSVRY